MGLLGTRASQEAVDGCDALLIVGSTFPCIEYHPKIGQARGVQVDRDPTRIGLRFPVEVGLAGTYARNLEKALDQGAPGAERVREALAREPCATMLRK